MRVSELDLPLVHVAGAVLGAACGVVGARVADHLPRRLGVTHLASAPRRTRRDVVVIALTTAIWIGVAHVLAGARDLSLAHGALLLATNGLAAAAVVVAAAIDLEHMILPNELTIGGTAICLVTSPLRAVGLRDALFGAALGLALTTLPLLLYTRIRKQSGIGLGDAKLAIMAGAWHGTLGVPFVLGLAALQSTLTALVMRIAGVSFAVPESVKAEIDELRARAAAGDDEAKRELALDPMAAEARDGVLAMRLPLGPFLAVACVEVLFLRRWLLDVTLTWLAR